MEENKVLIQVADTFTEKEFHFSIKVQPKTFKDKLLNWIGKFEQERKFVIHQPPIGLLAKITAQYLSIDKGLLDQEQDDWKEVIYNLSVDYSYTMAKIMALSVQVENKNPSEELIQFFLSNISSTKLKYYTNIIKDQLELVDFMSSIILIGRLKVLQGMNPTDQGS